jgi:hypothetical protein
MAAGDIGGTSLLPSAWNGTGSDPVLDMELCMHGNIGLLRHNHDAQLACIQAACGGSGQVTTHGPHAWQAPAPCSEATPCCAAGPCPLSLCRAATSHPSEARLAGRRPVAWLPALPADDVRCRCSKAAVKTKNTAVCDCYNLAKAQVTAYL